MELYLFYHIITEMSTKNDVFITKNQSKTAYAESKFLDYLQNVGKVVQYK